MALENNDHFIGHSQFYDVERRMVHRTGWEMRIAQGIAWLITRNPRTQQTQRQKFTDPKVVAAYAIWMGMLRDMSDPDFVFTDTVVPRRTKQCEMCGGFGGATDHDGNWIGCSSCDEIGMV